MGNPHRAEQTVDLGELGVFSARPTFDAICRIEEATAPIMVLAEQLIAAYSIRVVSRILHECIAAASGSHAPTLEQVGAAVQEIGVDVMVEPARLLIMANFSDSSETDDDGGTESPGNGEGATPPQTDASLPPAS